MNYHNITHDDMNNGDGLRVVLWVAGCDHHCKDRQNPITWNPDDGLPFTAKDVDEIFKELGKDYVAGITFSGGDPLHPANRADVLHLMNEIKAHFPEQDGDLVPVVRCEDCWHHNNCGIEQAALAPIGFFCALGERKDDAK